MQWTVLRLDTGAARYEGEVMRESSVREGLKERRKEKEGETQLVAGPGVMWQAQRH